MTTLTINIPEKEEASLYKYVAKSGGRVLASTSKDGLSKNEQLSLIKGSAEAKEIEEGNNKGLSFDDLWDE